MDLCVLGTSLVYMESILEEKPVGGGAEAHLTGPCSAGRVLLGFTLCVKVPEVHETHLRKETEVSHWITSGHFIVKIKAKRGS